MLYLIKDSDNTDAANDAAKLMEAWEVQASQEKLQKATNFLKYQAALFSTVARYCEVKLQDPCRFDNDRD